MKIEKTQRVSSLRSLLQDEHLLWQLHLQDGQLLWQLNGIRSMVTRENRKNTACFLIEIFITR